jgi:ribonuclease HII
MIEKNNNIIYIDIAGRGSIFGKLYACAVILNDNNDPDEINLKNKKNILNWINNNFIYGIGFVNNNEIDKLICNNGTQTSLQIAIQIAIQLAIDDLLKRVEIINYEIYINGYGCNNNKKCTTVINNNNEYYGITIATIISQYYYNIYIEYLSCKDHDLDIKYNLLRNKGLPTKQHLEGIKKYGLSKYHRKSNKYSSYF